MTETKLFGDLELSKKVHSAIMDMGFEEPSPIQLQAIPLLMEGSDVIGQAQTGTGKTAAFGIPIVEKVNPKLLVAQALILTPTRELAIQVSEEIAKIGKLKGVRTLPIYGGQPIDRQIRALRMGVQVVIGTPGRLLDHISRRTINLSRLQMVILDEADEMLDMGFVDDIESILKETPAERQTLLFSATMPDAIQRLARRYLKEPKWITVSKDELTVPLTEQYYYEIREKDRLEALCRVIDATELTQAIIFCRTKRGVDDLANSLQGRGYAAEGLHGDLSQPQRDRVMKKFRDGSAEILVATDVAARGIDVDNVSHVINLEVPQDPESYVHRIGRTGRAGRSGVAITFILPREYKQLRLIERTAKTHITRAELPTLADVAERQKEVIQDKLRMFITEGSLELYKNMLTELVEEFDPIEIAAAALKLNLDFGDEEIQGENALSFGNTGARAGMVRFFLNIGRQDNMGPREIIGFITDETGVSGNTVGNIKIYDRFSFVEVREEVAEKIFYCLQRTSLRGRRVSMEPARNRNDR